MSPTIGYSEENGHTSAASRTTSYSNSFQSFMLRSIRTCGLRPRPVGKVVTERVLELLAEDLADPELKLVLAGAEVESLA